MMYEPCVLTSIHILYVYTLYATGRRTARVFRSIQGISLEELTKKREQKPETRKAEQDIKLREQKEKQKKSAETKKKAKQYEKSAGLKSSTGYEKVPKTRRNLIAKAVVPGKK